MADAMPSESPLVLTNLQLVRLVNGLASLDGISPQPGEFEPFNFSAETTFKIAANAALLADKVAAFERAKKLLAVKYQIGERMPITTENAQRVSDFMEASALLEEKAVEVDGIEKLTRSELNVGFDCKKAQNQIAASTVAALWPVLEA